MLSAHEVAARNTTSLSTSLRDRADANLPLHETTRVLPAFDQNPGGDTIVSCSNNPPPHGDIKEKVSLLWDPDFPTNDRLIADSTGFGQKSVTGDIDGGRFFLFRRFGAKPDKKIVDGQAASPSSWKTPFIATCMVW